MTQRDITEFDIFYLSYDEPNKEKHYADLLSKCPWAKRVDGVKGFDNAHKECAKQSETDRFITVDGDNIVDISFFDVKLDLTPQHDTQVFSWAAKNMTNGLVYGNGGLKCWPKELVLNMKSHENADDERAAIEFCWNTDYVQMNNMYSKVWANGSAKQAFRAGFREGVKMSLDQGLKVNIQDFNNAIHHKNLKRLMIWCSVGADVNNGIWSVYGARLGCYFVNFTDWDFHNVRDYDWFNEFWESDIKERFSVKDDNWDNEVLAQETIKLGNWLRNDLKLSIAELDATQSEFFKKVYVNPTRTGAMITETQVNDSIE